MKIMKKFSRVLAIVFLWAALGAPSLWAGGVPFFSGSGEMEEWMGTYFKGQKLGFTHAKLKWSPEGFVVNTRTFVRMSAGGEEQITSFTQETRLGPDLDLKRLSLLQNIMGHRQHLEGTARDGKLTYTVKSLGFDKKKTIPFGAKMAPSATIFLNVIQDGLKVGRKGEMQSFLEPFQMSADFKFHIQAKEIIQHQGQPVETYRIWQQLSFIESTVWVTEEGRVLKEVSPTGFESFNEPEEVATKLDDAINVSHMITLSLVKTEEEIRDPDNKKAMKFLLSRVSSEDVLPQDHRQKVLLSRKSGDGTYETTLQVHAEPDKVKRSLPLPVSYPQDPELLEDSSSVQSKHPQIRSLARLLMEDVSDSWEGALRINQWVFSNLEKDLVDTVTALDALRERRGECQSHTYLFTAIARAAGIPTKIVNGLVYSPQFGGFLYHAWPEVFVGEWRALDPTFGQTLVDATHIKLSEGEAEGTLKLMAFLGQVGIEVLEN